MELIGEYKVSIQKATAAVMLPRSGWYYKVKPKNDELLCMRMHEIAHTRIRYGFWRIVILLRREGFKDDHKRVYRLYKAEGLNLRSKRYYGSRAGIHRENYPVVKEMNQCWSMDFVSDALYNG